MEYNFCRRCGSKLNRVSGAVHQCNNGHETFAVASPAVGIFFINKAGQVLLSIRGREPFKGSYDTIGGFVDSGETYEQALKREVEEETGLTPSEYSDFTYLCSAVSIYPYQDEDKDVLSVFYYAHIKPGAKPKAMDDVAELEYVDLETVDINKAGAQDIKFSINKMKEVMKSL